MASTDEGRWLEGIQHPEQHDPLCPESWQPGYYLCICDRLRACEARVREQTIVSYDMKRAEQAERNGYVAALDAARDAVAALLGKTVPPSDGVTEALAAIDALSEDR